MNTMLDPKLLAIDVRAAQNGDPEAMNRLLVAVQDMVYYSCLRMLRNETDAQDASQEILITVYRRIDALADPLSYLGWVKRITANRCRDRLGASNKAFLLHETEDGADALAAFEEPDEQRVPDKALDNAETRRMINELIDRLPDEQRICVILYYYNEMKTREIAEALNVSEGTVKSRLNYARKSIKAGVEEYEKQGIKLYGLSPLLFLGYFLRASADATHTPFTVAMSQAPKAAASAANSAASATNAPAPRANASTSRTSAFAAKAAGKAAQAAGTSAKAGTGFGAFLSTVAGKVTAAILAVALLGGAAVGTAFAVKAGKERSASEVIASVSDGSAAVPAPAIFPVEEQQDSAPVEQPQDSAPVEQPQDGTPDEEPTADTPPVIPYDPTPVTFQNPAFEQVLRQRYDLPETICRSDVLSMQELDLSECGLKDISDVAMFENLRILDFSKNSISDISALRELIHLETLSLRGNLIFDTELSAISGLKSLTYLDLSDNPINGIGALKGLTELTDLRLHGMMLEYIGALSGMTKLENLDLSENELQSYKPLYGLTTLKHLDISENPISKEQLNKLKSNLPDCDITY